MIDGFLPDEQMIDIPEVGSVDSTPTEYPYVYVNKVLTKAELDFILRVTNKKDLTEENSLNLFYKEGKDYEFLGKLLSNGLESVSIFKILDIPLYFVTSEDDEPVDLIVTENLKMFIKISVD